MLLSALLALFFTCRICFQLTVRDVKCVIKKEYTDDAVKQSDSQPIHAWEVCDGKDDCLSGMDEEEHLCNFVCGGVDRLVYTIYQVSGDGLKQFDWRKCIHICYNMKHCSNVEFIYTNTGTLYRCDFYATYVSALAATSRLHLLDKVRTVQLRSNCDLGCYENECYHLEPNEGVACKDGSPATVYSQQQRNFLQKAVPIMFMFKGIQMGFANVSFIKGASGEDVIRWQDGTIADRALLRGNKTYDEEYCTYSRYRKIELGYIGTEFRFEIITQELSNCIPVDWYVCKVAKSDKGIHMPDMGLTLMKFSFQCEDGDFVSSLAACDGKQDCLDGSDEFNCDREETTECKGQFQCKDGGCVPYSVFCDYVEDCPDGSDEDCIFKDCKGYEMKCLNSQCVSNMMICNGHQDCFDGTDECLYNCWKDGHNYTGKAALTVTGRTCQRWDSQVPHTHLYNIAEYFPEDTLDAVQNYCRDPTTSRGYHPWCYTDDINTPWEYCAIPKCPTSFNVRSEDCYSEASEWQGTLSETISGFTCQEWSSQLPHYHWHTNPAKYPDYNLTLAKNYCRDPSGAGRPWCYTTDKNKRYDLCDVPPCAPNNCYINSSTWQGTVTLTTSGRYCQYWKDTWPHKHDFTMADFPDDNWYDVKNFCRDPTQYGHPWCFTTDINVRWEFCHVPLCYEETCYRNSTTWRGNVTRTKSGHTCQKWSSQSPHSHTFTDPTNFPDDSLTDASNFCRDPAKYGQPWCFTTDEYVLWEFCDVPVCDNESCYITASTWRGKVSRTASGRTCQMWSSQSPHSHTYTYAAQFPDDSLTEASNFCRDPSNFGQLWCYTTDASVAWEVCNVPVCVDESPCFTESVLWRGVTAKTISGLTCQMWSSQSPHSHWYTHPGWFPDNTVVDAANYCRDPAGYGTPWCFTIYKLVEWEFCNVPACKNETSCPAETVKCQNDDCVRSEILCDGDNDCPHGEDEQGCQNIDKRLLYSNYICRTSNERLSRTRVCDGKIDCPHGDDERFCTVDNCPNLCYCDVYEVKCVGLNDSDNFERILNNIPSYVRLLDMSHSNTSGNLSILQHLPYIAKLNMQGCGLASISVASMPNLLSFDLSENSISNIHRNMFGGLRFLRSVNFQSNIIAYLNLDVFRDISDMTFINASRNKILFIERKSLETLPNLQTLDLTHNRLSTIALNMLSGMRRLRNLMLAHNRISNIESKSHISLNNLGFLDLSHNKIRLLAEKVMIAMNSLHVLLLNGNEISKLSSGMFQHLKNLTTLSLKANKINEVENYCFKGLHLLETLDISRNKIALFQGNMFYGLSYLLDLKTDKYIFCCLKPQTVTFARCEPQADEFSSCENLLRNEGARVLMWNIGIFALFGNCASLAYRLRNDKRKSKLGFGVFVLNLTVSDFFMGVYLMIIAGADAYYSGVYIWNDETWRDSALCKFAGILSTLSSEASVFFICLITIDRLLVVRYPFGRFKFTTKSAAAVSSFSWLLAILIAIVPVLHTDVFGYDYYSTNSVCIALPLTSARPSGWEYSLTIFVFFNFFTFLLIAFGQVLIFKEINDSKQKTAPSSKRKSDLAVARNLLLVVTTDFMCWFPVGVMGIISLTGHVISGDVNVWASVLILPINAALNPFLYTLSAIIKKKKFLPNVKEQSQVVEFDLKTFQTIWTKLSSKNNPRTHPLQDVVDRRKLKLTEIILINITLVSETESLHAVGLYQGQLGIDMVNVSLQDDVIKDVLVKLLPKPINKDENKADDMKQLGDIGRILLMHIEN